MSAIEGAVHRFRWGILSTAGIANKFVLAVRKSETSVVTAVASRSLSKAQTWGSDRDIPKAYGSYEELLADHEVDGVYIPLPTTMKSEWAVKAAEKGKHVLVEKPFASEADIRIMEEACVKNNVQFMDGTMWVHHIRAEKVRRWHKKNVS